MNKLKEGVDFNYLIPETEEHTVGVKLLTGKFAGTIYQYGKVGFEEEKDGATYLRFIYNIVESSFDKEELENNMEFKNHLGDILVSILTANLDKGLLDEAGTEYSEEPDSK